MGLSIDDLLFKYLSKEQIQDALRDIGEPTSGTKDELVRNLKNRWKSYNRDYYDLLDFVDAEMLEAICYHYKLDDSPTSPTGFKKRIKNANLLDVNSKNKKSNSTTTPRPPTKLDWPREIPDTTHSDHKQFMREKPSKPAFIHTKKAWLLGLIIPLVLGILYQDSIHAWLFPSEPSIIIEVNAQGGIIEKSGSILEYSPRTIPASGTFPETFFVNIMNRGDADAHNFYIVLKVNPKTNDWFNYGDTKVVSDTLPPVCKTKSSECNMDVIPEGGSMRLDYKVELKPSDYELIRSENPTIVFEYKYDEISNPQQVIVKINIPS